MDPENAQRKGVETVPSRVSVTSKELLAQPQLADEVFEPLSVLVRCETAAELRAVVEQMPSQLTVSLLVEEQDYDLANTFVPILERKAGRIVFNGYPTGVEVSHAWCTVAPFPAASDSRKISAACQLSNMPQGLLPESLRDTNPMKIVRQQDAKLGM